MVNSILITNSGVNRHSGGGIVSTNLMEALKSCSELKLILSNGIYPDNKFEGVRAVSINPHRFKYGELTREVPTPFFMDYLAYHELPDEQMDIGVFYGCPFAITAEKLKNSGCKIISDLAPHNIDISREEHIKLQGSYPFPHLTNPYLLKLYLRHLRLSDRVIVHSNISAEYIMKEAGLKELPTVIPHGTYIPEEIKPLPENYTIGNLGAMGADKGTMYIVRAWLSMTPSLTEKNKLLTGGTGSGVVVLKDEDKKFFKFLGFLDNVSDFYNNISVLVHPSVVEGFGITVIESMAYGRPVIVAEGAGAHELVTDGVDGFVVPIRDVPALIDKINYYYENPDEIKRMGRNAAEKAKNFSWNIIKKQYVKVFEEYI